MEIDALFHGPAWTPRATFAAEVDAFSAEPEWVTEWQYAWSTHHKSAQRVATVHQQRPRLIIVRLADQREVEHWIGGP